MSAPSRRRVGLWFLAGSLFLIAAAFGAGVWEARRFLDSTGGAQGPEPIIVHIPPGAGVRQVAGILAKEGIISDPEKFRYLVRWRGVSGRLQAGEFDFQPGLRPEAVLERLVAGQPVLYRITVPEGYTLVQIAGLLDQKGIWSGEKFLIAARDPGFTASLGIPHPSLEGYLFPETYSFPRSAGEAEIVRAMVHRMEKEFTPESEAAMTALGFSRHEALTLASIVEKETGLAYERPLVASVFLNRLQRGMRLQSDPTVIYGLPNYDGNLRKPDLETWTPYNTYRIAGLPPGPIANPGSASIHAVLHAPKTNYLFFVARGDGSHEFSVSYRDHTRAVDRFQRGLGR
jgi:UPF0755 protein